jgi:hypothetical protein
MISPTNHDFQWGRSEVVIICPDGWNLPVQMTPMDFPALNPPSVWHRVACSEPEKKGMAGCTMLCFTNRVIWATSYIILYSGNMWERLPMSSFKESPKTMGFYVAFCCGLGTAFCWKLRPGTSIMGEIHGALASSETSAPSADHPNTFSIRV